MFFLKVSIFFDIYGISEVYFITKSIIRLKKNKHEIDYSVEERNNQNKDKNIKCDLFKMTSNLKIYGNINITKKANYVFTLFFGFT